MSQIVFKSGDFKDFVATRTFSLGTTADTIEAGTQFQFDGLMMDLHGDAKPLPQLRGAYKAGWIVLLEDYTGEPVAPPSAGIRVSAATGNRAAIEPMAVTLSDDNRVVGSVDARQQRVHKASSPGKSDVGALTQDDHGQEARTVRKLSSPSKRTVVDVDTDPDREAAVEPVSVAPHQGKVVGRLKTGGATTSEGITVKTVTSGDAAIYDAGGGSEGSGRMEVSEHEGIRFTSTAKPKRKVSTQEPTPLDPLEQLAQAKELYPDFPENFDFAWPVKKKMARIVADFDGNDAVLRAIYQVESTVMRDAMKVEFPSLS